MNIYQNTNIIISVVPPGGFYNVERKPNDLRIDKNLNYGFAVRFVFGSQRSVSAGLSQVCLRSVSNLSRVCVRTEPKILSLEKMINLSYVVKHFQL